MWAYNWKAMKYNNGKKKMNYMLNDLKMYAACIDKKCYKKKKKNYKSKLISNPVKDTANPLSR